MRTFSVDGFEVGAGRPLFLICGPCVIESEEHALRIGRAVRDAAAEAGTPAVFKASFDKANRTSVDSLPRPGARRRPAHLGRGQGPRPACPC